MSDAPSPSSQPFLKNKADFDRVKREGTKRQTSWFTIVFCSSPTMETRVGIVVGKRFGNAVMRNRGKRIFREIVRKTHRFLVKGSDIIVFPKTTVLTQNHQALCESWMNLLAREGLIKSSADPIPCVK